MDLFNFINAARLIVDLVYGVSSKKLFRKQVVICCWPKLSILVRNYGVCYLERPAMIPRWKLKRELFRLYEQIGSVPLRIIEPVHRFFYNKNRWLKIYIHYGSQKPTSKYCLFLIYQPNIISKSIIETCDFMTKKGYSVILIANGGLLSKSLIAVLPNVWQILERPNIGYDFGGYRDGIHHLEQMGISPKYLILMNDSIWFPLWKDTQVVERLESSIHDLTGLFFHVPLRNEKMRQNGLSKLKRKRTEHIESYLTMVTQNLFTTDEFKRFWNSYKQSSSKEITIKRGEIGFSKVMALAGFSVGGLSQRKSFLKHIQNKSNYFLENTLKYAAYSDAKFEIERDALMENLAKPNWRAFALSHIQRVVERRRFNASFCWATEQIFETSFVKKNAGQLFKKNRLQILLAIDAGDMPADNLPAIMEIKALATKDKPSLK